MTLPEAIVYLLASSNHGMKTDVIARLINEKGLISVGTSSRSQGNRYMQSLWPTLICLYNLRV